MRSSGDTHEQSTTIKKISNRTTKPALVLLPVCGWRHPQSQSFKHPMNSGTGLSDRLLLIKRAQQPKYFLLGSSSELILFYSYPLTSSHNAFSSARILMEGSGYVQGGKQRALSHSVLKLNQSKENYIQMQAESEIWTSMVHMRSQELLQWCRMGCLKEKLGYFCRIWNRVLNWLFYSPLSVRICTFLQYHRKGEKW